MITMATMLFLQILIIAFAVFAISRAFLRLKDNKITIKEFVFWSIIWVALVVFALIPRIIEPLSGIFGLERGADVLIYLSIIILFYLMFRLYVKLESVEQSITRLVREVAIKKEQKKKK